MARKTQRRRRVKTRPWPSGSDANGIGGGAGSSRAILKLKLEHMIVLQALEDANRTHGRAVGVFEITEEISEKDKKRLEKTYSNDLSRIITKTLALLSTRGLVFSPGASGRRRFYGSVYILDPSGTSLPDIRSRRSKVMGLVREAVLNLGRAVRSLDIIEHATTSGQEVGLSEADITHDVLSLAETGELSVVGRVRGEGKGFNLYLPSDMDTGSYKLLRPLTWLDEVAQTVEALWAERVEEAKVKGARPKPLTTGDIRARIVNSSFHTQREIKKDPQIIVDAVKNLAETRDPLLRKIKRRGQKALLWVPVGVPDEEVDFGGFYANDAERMGAAVERAVRRLGRPVTVRDVQDEVEADFALLPANSSGVFQALAYAARETFNDYNGKGRQERRTRRVQRIGRAGANTYYHMDDAPEARSFVQLRRLELKWTEVQAEKQLEGLQTVSLPCVAKGRAMLLTQQANVIRREIVDLLKGSEMDGATRREAEGLKEHVDQTAEATMQWLGGCELSETSLPLEVMTATPGWTAAEFLQVVKPLYPLAENVTSTQKFITLMHDSVRRVPNLEFDSRFVDDPVKAAEFLFDRTDALIYAATRWGGTECFLQATLAKQELGHLRDPRFVFPSLKAKDFESRLAGVACLAFLWSNEGNYRLKIMANDDPDPGVRQSALWAYGFAGGVGAKDMLKDKEKNDPNERVREFATQALKVVDESWWKI